MASTSARRPRRLSSECLTVYGIAVRGLLGNRHFAFAARFIPFCNPSTALLHYCCGVMTPQARSEEHTSELQSLMRISYAVFCLTKKKKIYSNINKLLTTQTQQHST